MIHELTYKIFLVDDDMKHLLLLKDQLENRLNYKLDIETFTTGKDALNALDRNPDIVILDYYLDGEGDDTENGIAYLKRILARRPNLPVVMMSQQDKIEVVVECYDYGAKEYIAKNETAYARALIVMRNLIQEKARELRNKQLLDGANKAKLIMAGFIILLLGIVALLAFDHV